MKTKFVVTAVMVDRNKDITMYSTVVDSRNKAVSLMSCICDRFTVDVFGNKGFSLKCEMNENNAEMISYHNDCKEVLSVNIKPICVKDHSYNHETRDIEDLEYEEW